MILAVEADGASYRDSGSVRDRDRLRKEHLERLGWNVHRLWSTNWLHDPDAEVAKLRKAYDRAVASAPRSQPPEPPEPYDPPEPHEPPEPIEPPGPDEPPAPQPSTELATRPPGTPATL
jgi:REase_MTES_1575